MKSSEGHKMLRTVHRSLIVKYKQPELESAVSQNGYFSYMTNFYEDCVESNC